MFCKYCGKQIDDDSQFCKFCGCSLSNSKKVVSSSQTINIIRYNPLEKLYCAIVLKSMLFDEDKWFDIKKRFFKDKCSVYQSHMETIIEMMDRSAKFSEAPRESITLSKNITVSYPIDRYGAGYVYYFNKSGDLVAQRPLSLYKSTLVDEYFLHKSIIKPTQIYPDIKTLLSDVLSGIIKGKKYDLISFSKIQEKFYGNRYLFFDTETTGLPNNENAPIEDNDNWPRLVQLSWIMTDNKNRIINEQNFIIKPDGYIIPSEATRIHGISTEDAKHRGYQLEEALDLFTRDLEVANVVIGHNIQFDQKIIAAEFHRLGWVDYKKYIQSIKSICTMKKSKDYCKLPNVDYWTDKYRYPKLTELYYMLFSEHLCGAHDSFADVEATRLCFFELVKKRVIKLPV